MSSNLIRIIRIQSQGTDTLQGVNEKNHNKTHCNQANKTVIKPRKTSGRRKNSESRLQTKKTQEQAKKGKNTRFLFRSSVGRRQETDILQEDTGQSVC